ncbi:MAG: hypothetical protein FWE03_04945 [Firmicutes bacterium]|nr:hypothetical protein [Bacillota bacterium]
MDKILNLIIEDYHNREFSSDYELALNKFCEKESIFMKLLSKKQKAEYIKLSFFLCELTSIEQQKIGEYVYKTMMGLKIK